jgi:CheY-like chemotaxis protein
MSQSVLVVDDTADNRDLTKILLECEGFEVRLAEDAPQALLALRDWTPQMILMDIQLPGVDGLELTRCLRRNNSLDGMLIVALSAYAMPADKEKARDAGCDGYITKPINTRIFAGSVREYLNAGRNPSGLREQPKDRQ